MGDVRRLTSPRNVYGSQAGEAWAAGHAGSAQTYVGIIDEGLQFDHPDLDGNAWTNPSTRSTASTTTATATPTTPTAGTSPATTRASTTAAPADGSTSTARTWRARSAARAATARLNIVATNNSWGGGGFSQALLDAINRGGNAGILFVAAAGNGGQDQVGDNNDAVASYPSNCTCTANGTYDCVIAVASITSTGARSSFSNYGARTVDLGAPGSSITSTLPFNGYGSSSGTSMAPPHVSGGAALYASTHPGATAAQIRSALLASAAPTPSLVDRTVTGGRLDVSGF